MTATTLDEVIDQLTTIIETSRTEASRAGYFAALYRAVTVQVRDGVAAGRFDDGPRMARLDVAFANRYLTAYEQYRRGDSCTRVWQVAFEAGEQSGYLALQHLLLGMNAHINLDLGIAAAETAPGDALADLENDFTAINTILASLVDDVQNRIGTFSPWLGWLDTIGARTDEAIVNFSMGTARESAWDFAQELAPLSVDERTAVIDRRDVTYADFARVITRPGLLLSLIILLIGLRESRDVAHVINVLSRDTT